MYRMKKNILTLAALVCAQFSFSQDLLDMVADSAAKPEKEFVSAPFKSSRNINFHTTEVLPERSMDVRISHRFGVLESKAYNAWGIDGPANLMISLEYSYDGNWMVGLQRSFYEKMGAAFFKWKFLKQAKNGGSPVAVTYFGGAYNTWQKDPYLGEPDKFYDMEWDRYSFVNQLLVSRKFNDWISAQLGFAYVHYNLVGAANGFSKNDVMVGTGVLRTKFTKRQAIIMEYGYRASTDYGAIDPSTGDKIQYQDCFGMGWEIETGGHVFQVFVTNSFGILENQFLIKNTGDYSTSGMRIGFNIMRVFSVGGKKKW